MATPFSRSAVAASTDAEEPGRAWLGRERLLLGFTALCALVLLAGLVLHLFAEAPGSNSYALLADAWLHGRFSGDRCFDGDCAHFAGKLFVIFPPVPAVLALPFVAIFGENFAGFAAIGAVAAALTLYLWWRIFALLDVERRTAVWLMLALAVGSPVYYVTIRADQIWFYAQSIGLLLVTFALFEVLRGGRLWLAGAAIGAAFLCRQMSLLYLPFLFALALQGNEPLISLRWPHIRRALKLGLPVAAAIGIYLVYNYVRFGTPMDTGYAYIRPDATGGNWINFRIQDIGLFSPRYVFFNLLYLFVQGFHFDFGGRYMLDPLGMDPIGTSLLAASPFVLLAIFTPMKRSVVIGLLTIVVMAAPILFYHSNGFVQHNVQRYTLDWLPILFYLLAFAIGPRLRPALAVLVTYAVALNVVTMVLLRQYAS